MNWTLFSTAYTMIVGPLAAATPVITEQILYWVRLPMLVGITAWIGLQAIAAALHAAPWSSLIRGIIRSGIVVVILESLNSYQDMFANVAQTIPVELTAAVAGGGAGGLVQNGQAFDKLMSVSLHAALLTWEHIPKYNLSAAVLTGISIPLYAIFVVAFVASAFLIYLAAAVMLHVLIVIGPLAIVMVTFPTTHRAFSGWLGAVMAAILTQVLAVVLLALMTGVILITTTPILSNATSANFVDELLLLLCNGVLLWIISQLTKEIPSIAASICSGVYQNVGGFYRATLGAAGRMVPGAANAGRQMAAAVGQHAGSQVGAGAVRAQQLKIVGRSRSGP